MRFLPPYALATAASITRTLARQMSAPVPSPSMNGMIGLSGTCRMPLATAIFAPPAGGATLAVAAVDMSGLLGNPRAQRRRGAVMLAQRGRGPAAACPSAAACVRLRGGYSSRPQVGGGRYK